MKAAVFLSSTRSDGNQKVQRISKVNKEIVSLNIFQEERSVSQLGWLTSTCAPSFRTPAIFVTETVEVEINYKTHALFFIPKISFVKFILPLFLISLGEHEGHIWISFRAHRMAVPTNTTITVPAREGDQTKQ